MNQLKTVLLLGILTGLVVGAGYYFGGQQGAIWALALSALMNFGTYWFSDKMVLAMYGAKEIPENQERDLHQTVKELAQRTGIPKPRLYMVNMPVPNAFATGRDKNHAVVAVTPKIIELLTHEELRGVLSHELSHITNRDMLVSTIAATLAGAISYLAQMAYFGGMITGQRDDEHEGNAFGAIAILILAPIIATLIHLAVSRSREFMADESGAKLSHKPRDLASALAKLHGFSKSHPIVGEPKHEATAHLFIVNPFKPSLLVSLLSTHPPVAERIKRLESMRI
ncbi:zinc metalloprotease HtpX [Candidatus Microgenomates bacterium]|nr:zinc metalloprotease HtpX [Candidatus Microgenomates bacterium]